MRNTFRLFAIVGVASLITTTMYFGVILALLPVLRRPNLPRIVQAVVLAVTLATPIGAAAWWIFKKLRPNYSQRTARAAAIAFGLFTPVSLGVGVLLSTIIGAYAEGLAGYPFFGLAGAFLGIVIVTTLLSFVPCVFTLWITHRGEAAHQAQ